MRTRVIRYNPRRRLLRRLGFGLVLSLLVIGAYLGGHWRAGVERQLGMNEAAVLRSQLQRAQDALAEARQKLVSLEAGAQIDREALTQVRAEVADERASVARLEHEVMLFKGLMDSSVRTRGMALQGIELRRDSRLQRYRYRITLLQRADQQEDLTGSLNVTILGKDANGAKTFVLSELDEALEGDSLSIGFRYFQVFEGKLELPQGFVPETIRLKASARGSKRYSIDREIDWTVIE